MDPVTLLIILAVVLFCADTLFVTEVEIGNGTVVKLGSPGRKKRDVFLQLDRGGVVVAAVPSAQVFELAINADVPVYKRSRLITRRTSYRIEAAYGA